MTRAIVRTAKYWRHRAKESRAIADEMRGRSREMMLSIARQFDRLAKQQEEKERERVLR